MTDNVSLINLALQSFGDRTTITAAQLVANSNNQAIQANLAFNNVRDGLLRMAPWDCGMKTANLTYITSIPGTPENTSPATTLWQPGQPRPPWAYEYQYPVDCLKACWIIPAIQTGYAGGIPITTAVTGGAPTTWNGAPIRFKVATDQFYPVTGIAIVNGGINFAIGDIITLPRGPSTSPPIGAPLQLQVESLGAFNAVASASIINTVIDSNPSIGGSYFAKQLGGIPQDTTSGSGTFFICSLIQGNISDQRVVLTNQEFATLAYVKQVIDPNVWDPLFQDAFYNALGAVLCKALTGDKALANACIAEANRSIIEARTADGNEGLTINDVTPDFIRSRGISWTDGMYSGPYSGFDWGGLLPSL